MATRAPPIACSSAASLAPNDENTAPGGLDRPSEPLRWTGFPVTTPGLASPVFIE